MIVNFHVHLTSKIKKNTMKNTYYKHDAHIYAGISKLSPKLFEIYSARKLDSLKAY